MERKDSRWKDPLNLLNLLNPLEPLNPSNHCWKQDKNQNKPLDEDGDLQDEGHHPHQGDKQE